MQHGWKERFAQKLYKYTLQRANSKESINYNAGIIDLKFNYCAKRSFHPYYTSNSAVRSWVREIIDSYEGEQKAASRLLSTGGLSS